MSARHQATAGHDTTVLEVHHLSKAFGGVLALEDLGFAVSAGQLVALIGPNGAGKSTCFNLLGGQIRPDRGQVLLAGRDITGMAAARIWRLGVGRTFQITATFASMTVRENVQMVLLSHHRRLGRFLARPARDQLVAPAEALLDKVGLLSEAGRAASVLAYGDLKRLELAMALAATPRLLLMDEPTAGMGSGERVELMALTARIARAESIAVLFTEHDMDVVFAHADQVLAPDRGRLIASGEPAAVRADERVQQVYLGSRARA